MTMLLPVLALVVALGAIGAAFTSSAMIRGIVAAAWAVAFVGLGLIYFDQAGSFADALALGALAMVGLLPGSMSRLDLRRQVFSVTPIFALVLALGAVAVSSFTAPAQTGSMWLLLAVQAGVIGAALSAALSASALVDRGGVDRGGVVRGGADDSGKSDRRPIHLGIPLVMASLATGLGIIGSLRATLPGSRYALPLRTEEGPLVWGWAEGALQGQKLLVIMSVDWMVTGLFIVGTVAVAGAISAAYERHRKAAAALFLGSGTIALGLLGNLLYLTGQALNPSPQPYVDIARRMLIADRLPESLLAEGGFSHVGVASVDLSAMGPEFVLLGLIFLLGLSRALFLLKGMDSFHSGEVEDVAPRRWRRDLLVRAVVLGWLAWIVSLTYHLETYGVVGLVGPGEWMILGSMLLSTGLLLMIWEERRESTMAAVLRRAVPGVMAGVWILAVSAAYGYGAFFAVSALLR